ncbi:hypothetical protein GCM10023115_55760 [Pontixanthobacter gangjinensis]|uniref:Replication initiation factor n=1 Tax=Pontixanthobacter gangjinensis TaxID=1028742 RepID=A0A6I4SQE5_9SPHN|nr:hypothetical protein [Pontixanthobacter gangjinensis]MXO57859.1 hypothetical protein [Pontixanthobacter gangjinensis]
MEVVYQGFDGLDFSLQGQISPALEQELEAAKLEAKKQHGAVVLDWKGAKLHVKDSGARGGYSYLVSTGDFGATWFFKKPNVRDPWGVRVSCNSFLLATYGFAEARNKIYELLDLLEVKLKSRGESIGRIDYAVDILAPEFELVPERFVMHSNANRADHWEPLEISTNGKSGRTSSVTVGKMPGQQVIVYDKRAEVISKHKHAWWVIWNAAMQQKGLPPLDHDDPDKSRIWRVEYRTGKKFLKDRWNIRSWADVANRYGDLVSATAQSIRYTNPTSDSNRSRWPDSTLWLKAKAALDTDLFEMRSYAEPCLIKQVHQHEHSELLQRQMTGLLTSKAAINGIDADSLSEFARLTGNEMATAIQSAPEDFAEKLKKAEDRYFVY